jgi:hypothetical protein
MIMMLGLRAERGWAEMSGERKAECKMQSAKCKMKRRVEKELGMANPFDRGYLWGENGVDEDGLNTKARRHEDAKR